MQARQHLGGSLDERQVDEEDPRELCEVHPSTVALHLHVDLCTVHIQLLS